MIEVQKVSSIDSAIFPASAFSLISLPCNDKEASNLFKSVYNTPCKNHVMVVFYRGNKKNKMEALGNLKSAEEVGWKYLDTVCLWYEKPTSAGSTGFLPISEEVHLFYKGEAPNIGNTGWFSEDRGNATTLWGLTPADYEGRAATSYKHFCWEVALLLITMTDPHPTKGFVYALDDDYNHVIKFCKEYGRDVTFITTSDSISKKIKEVKE